jgi:hypothetical protein
MRAALLAFVAASLMGAGPSVADHVPPEPSRGKSTSRTRYASAPHIGGSFGKGSRPGYYRAKTPRTLGDFEALEAAERKRAARCAKRSTR